MQNVLLDAAQISKGMSCGMTRGWSNTAKLSPVRRRRITARVLHVAGIGVLPSPTQTLELRDCLPDGEELRPDSHARIVGAAVDALATACVPAIVLKGTGLELLLSSADMARAIETLRGIGCTHVESARSAGMVKLHHESGLPIVLRSRLLEPGYYPSGWDWFERRAVTRPIGGSIARVLSPADALHHACVRASSGQGRSSLQWVADAWMLLVANGRGAADRLDWDAFFETVDHCRSAIPALVALDYLANELDAPVPPEVLGRLDPRTERASATQRGVALRCAWGGLRRCLTAPMDGLAWRERAVLLSWLLFPSRGSLRLIGAAR